jgi:hypothetical protein
MAVRNNKYNLVSELIKNGADVNASGKSGVPSLEVAEDTYASKKIIKELKRRGAKKSLATQGKEFRRNLQKFKQMILELTVLILGSGLLLAGLILIFFSLKRDPGTFRIRLVQPPRIILTILYFTFIIMVGLNFAGRTDIIENIWPLIIVITFLTPILAAGCFVSLLKNIKSRGWGWFLSILVTLGTPCASILMILLIIREMYRGEAGVGIGYWIIVQSGAVLSVSFVVNLSIWLIKKKIKLK